MMILSSLVFLTTLALIKSTPPAVTYVLCATGYYCTLDFQDTSYSGQDPQTCANSCHALSSSNVYFDIDSTQGCFCATSCPSLSANAHVTTYAINGATCTPVPTKTPTASPTTTLLTAVPTFSPTAAPTYSPTVAPTFSPTIAPTYSPTVAPTFSPTTAPSVAPTDAPTLAPSASPSTASPSIYPSSQPSSQPSGAAKSDSSSNASNQKPLAIGLGVGLGLPCLAAILGIFFFLFYYRRRYSNNVNEKKIVPTAPAKGAEYEMVNGVGQSEP